MSDPDRTGDRAAPPSRLGRGSQPFPRRRPPTDPAAEEHTRAFRVDAPAEEATRANRLPDQAAGTRPVGVIGAPPADEAAQPLPRRRPPQGGTPTAEDATQRLVGASDQPGSYPPTVDREHDLPPSIAEPVSGPPAPRRTFSPIVIEGTIVESRDLPSPDGPEAAAAVNGWSAGRASAPEQRMTRSPLAAAAAPSDAGPHPMPDSHQTRGRPESYAAPESYPAPGRPESYGSPVVPEAYTVPEVPQPYPASPGPVAAPAAPEPVASEPVVSAPVGLAPTTVPPATAEPGPAATVAPGSESAGPRSGTDEEDFQPANDVEEDLLGAAGTGSTDTFLSTLLLARVLLPVAPDSAPGSRPGEPGFVWHTQQMDGETYVVVYTSPERLADRAGGPVETVRVKFVQLIRRWPDDNWSFAVNPGTPVGAKLPGEQIVGLANWAAEVGLGDDPENEPEAPAATEVAASRPPYVPPVADPNRPVVMQKVVAPSQLGYYLERGYDRVSGFVHRAHELAHLNTPDQLYRALGLCYADSPFAADAVEIYVLRWPAHRPSLYRIPYGGQNEGAMRAMEGWVIERPPFRGNGFAPGESTEVIAEFKVDSARLPHGAQLWRIGADGVERVVAILDTDALLWRPVGEQ
ncbi:SseB family protein [Micromonospora sp. ATA32]|nr:SseB family protein [Micromonospora sp. ATA32]